MNNRDRFELAMDSILPHWKALPEDSHLIRICFELWNASIDEPIKIPYSNQTDEYGYTVISVDDVIEAIEEAGYKAGGYI
jgi:hypothetical protein